MLAPNSSTSSLMNGYATFNKQQHNNRATSASRSFSPMGSRGRNSNNDLIRSLLDWDPKFSLYQGLEKTYDWIYSEIKKKHNQ